MIPFKTTSEQVMALASIMVEMEQRGSTGTSLSRPPSWPGQTKACST